MGNLISRRDENVKVIMLGMYSSGKTSILYELKLGEVQTIVPTIGFSVETLEYKKFKVTSWDVGGRDKVRPLWRHFCEGCDGMIFVVDSTESQDRINEARDEFYRCLEVEGLKNIPVAILANKNDLPNSLSTQEIEKAFDIHQFSRTNTCCTFSTSSVNGSGLYESLDWLSNEIKHCREKKNYKSLSTSDDKVTNVMKKTLIKFKSLLME